METSKLSPESLALKLAQSALEILGSHLCLAPSIIVDRNNSPAPLETDYKPSRAPILPLRWPTTLNHWHRHQDLARQSVRSLVSFPTLANQPFDSTGTPHSGDGKDLEAYCQTMRVGWTLGACLSRQGMISSTSLPPRSRLELSQMIGVASDTDFMVRVTS